MSDDYDIWQDWMMDALKKYGACAEAKAEIVEAWNK